MENFHSNEQNIHPIEILNNNFTPITPLTPISPHSYDNITNFHNNFPIIDNNENENTIIQFDKSDNMEIDNIIEEKISEQNSEQNNIQIISEDTEDSQMDVDDNIENNIQNNIQNSIENSIEKKINDRKNVPFFEPTFYNDVSKSFDDNIEIHNNLNYSVSKMILLAIVYSFAWYILFTFIHSQIFIELLEIFITIVIPISCIIHIIFTCVEEKEVNNVVNNVVNKDNLYENKNTQEIHEKQD